VEMMSVSVFAYLPP